MPKKKNATSEEYLKIFKEIHPVYQPIIEIKTKKIMGYEALIRGKGKHLNPQKLFQDSYAQGFTIPLDIECMRHAVKILPRLHPDQLLFVNVEPMTLSSCFGKDGDGYKLLKKTKGRAQIAFELTEGLKTWDLSLAKKGVNSLRKFKCRLALDDMKGIGLKLFEMLTLKPDFIKIDMSLIQGLTKNPLQQSIVEQLVQLGYKHKSEVIAEGLETAEQVRLVEKMDIRYAQGFFFGRPKPTPID